MSDEAFLCPFDDAKVRQLKKLSKKNAIFKRIN